MMADADDDIVARGCNRKKNNTSETMTANEKCSGVTTPATSAARGNDQVPPRRSGLMMQSKHLEHM